ncbi:MAG: hypothetical protein ABRQ25_14810 [Clostridiaceae bacterium]
MEEKIKKAAGIEYDPEYINYIESGESAAVFITRDIVKSIDTSNKWIDVIDLSVYEKHNRRAFNYIIVELFNRKINPQYPKHHGNNEEEFIKKLKKYITWKTAYEDIQNQRSKKVSGPKYLILTHLFNKNKGKGYWKIVNDGFCNVRLKCVCREVLSCYSSECKIKKIKCFIQTEKDDWQYGIKHVKILNDSQVRYIKENSYDIVEKIIENRNIDLSYFFDDEEETITSKKNNNKKRVNNHSVKDGKVRGKK